MIEETELLGVNAGYRGISIGKDRMDLFKEFHFRSPLDSDLAKDKKVSDPILKLITSSFPNTKTGCVPTEVFSCTLVLYSTLNIQSNCVATVVGFLRWRFIYCV